MRKDLLSATGKVVVKDRKQDLNAFFTVYLRSRKFEISCCDNGLPFRSEDEKQDINIVLDLWNSHCIGQTNIIYERYQFNNRNQESHESIDVYATALRALAATCEFGVLKDEMICDRLVCGITENTIRRKLLQEPKLSLEKCLDICRSAEATSARLRVISGQSTSTDKPVDTVNALDKRKKNESTSETT